MVIVAGQGILVYSLVVAPLVYLADCICENNFIKALQAYISNQK